MRALVRGCLLMTTSARAAAAAAEDVFGDGSVLKRIVHLGAGGPLPLRGEVVGCAYVGRLASGFVFERFDASSPFVFAVGEARIVSGLDRAVATMAVGEIADVEVRFDAGYGEAGLSGKGVPPRAALFFNGLEVLSLSAPRTADGEAALYLSEPRAENAAADENRRTLHVDGAPRRARAGPHLLPRRRGGPARLPRAHGRGQGRHGGAHHQLARGRVSLGGTRTVGRR